VKTKTSRRAQWIASFEDLARHGYTVEAIVALASRAGMTEEEVRAVALAAGATSEYRRIPQTEDAALREQHTMYDPRAGSEDEGC